MKVLKIQRKKILQKNSAKNTKKEAKENHNIKTNRPEHLQNLEKKIQDEYKM